VATDFKQQALAQIESHRDRLLELSDRIYSEPELGFQEHRAAQRLSAVLEEAGFRVDRGVAGMATAFVARRGGGPGPRIAILAEYDALPEIGHGCGHNIIGTAAVGAGLALAPLMAALGGELLVIGCPAEEGAVDNAGGKVVLVEAGWFDNVDAAMMVHPSTRNAVGGTSNARVALELKFHGKNAHAAGAPHEGINALDAAIQSFNGWNALRQHLKPDVRIHGIITRGGVSPNIVPDYAEVRMYVRSRDFTYLKEVEEKVKNCARGAALATGARVEFRYTAKPYYNLVTNRTLASAFADNLSALGLEVSRDDGGSTGSTDMGNVSHVTAAIHPYLAICPPGVAAHSREFAAASVSPATTAVR
jgi:amidohydrolase